MAAVLVVMALPLDFSGRLRILRTKFLSGALHAIEGSRISFCSLTAITVRFCFCRLVQEDAFGSCWCGFVLAGCPVGCDPGFYVLWCRFRLLRRYLAYRPLEVPRLYSLLGSVAGGCPGHGRIHMLVESAGIVGF